MIMIRKIVIIIIVLYCQPLSSHLLQPLLLGELLSKAVGCEVDDDLDEYNANDGDDHDNDHDSHQSECNDNINDSHLCEIE